MFHRSFLARCGRRRSLGGLRCGASGHMLPGTAIRRDVDGAVSLQWVDLRPPQGPSPAVVRFGCVTEDALRHYAECDVLRRASLHAGVELRPLVGLLALGPADLRQIAVAAEVYNIASHRRSAGHVVELAMATDGSEPVRDEVDRLARSVADVLPARRHRRRRVVRSYSLRSPKHIPT